MNTSFLDKCCSILEAAKQYKSDEFLVKLVRVQQLAQSISLTLALEPDQQAMQLPMTIVVQSFQDQLNSLRDSLPPELESNCMSAVFASLLWCSPSDLFQICCKATSLLLRLFSPSGPSRTATATPPGWP